MNETKNDGGPAFPHVRTQVCRIHEGMTLRDWFAGQALASADLNQLAISASVNGSSNEALAVLAEVCYDLADEMLKAREQ